MHHRFRKLRRQERVRVNFAAGERGCKSNNLMLHRSHGVLGEQKKIIKSCELEKILTEKKMIKKLNQKIAWKNICVG